MNKKSISSLELTAIVKELEILNKGKISQIYHQEKKELLFQLHAPGKGKQILKIVPGKYLCLSKKKEAPLRPSGFCMQLRKYINNAFIKSIHQQDAQRIVVLTLERQETYYLIIELYSKGNLILTDQNYKIITVLERQKWKDRLLLPNENYSFPPSALNWKKVDEKQLKKILQESDKKNLATSLATELGLGGLYAEEICHLITIDKNKLPTEVSDQEIKQIIKVIKEFLKKLEQPEGYIYEEQISPFKLSTLKEIQHTKTYNEAIDTLNPFQIISPYQQRINTLKNMIAKQEEAIQKQDESIEKNTKKGELIYENYAPLQKLLEIVKVMQQSKEWNEIALELKKERKIKSLDLKNKKIIIDL